MRANLKLLRTSTFRLAAVYLIVFALSVGAILAYVAWNTIGILEQQTDDTITAEVQALADQYRLRGLRGALETVRRRSSQEEDGVYLFASPSGQRLAGNLALLPSDAVGEQGWIEFPYAVDSPRGVERHIAKAFHTELQGGFRIVVGRDVQERRDFARIIRRTLFWAVGLTLVFGVSGGLLMSRNFLRRVEQINATGQAIMRGDFAERIPVAGTGDELDRLANGLNEMLDQIERLMKGMQQVSSNVAHDLRTPLTRLRARVEDALRTDDKDQYREALHQILGEADELLKTFNALLSIARAEAGQAGEGFVQLDLASLVSDIAELYQPTVEEAGGTMEVIASEPVNVRADRQLLAQSLTNLFDNALKYGRNPKTDKPELQVTCYQSLGEAFIEICDRGQGIAQEDRDRVTERFVRLDESRTEPGSGLGLSLVASVMKLHGGKLVLMDNEPGLKARLVLPSKPAPR